MLHVAFHFLFFINLILTVIVDDHCWLFQSKSIGQVLFDSVVNHLRLLESDYFGLEYYNEDTMPVGLTASDEFLHLISVLFMRLWLVFLVLCFVLSSFLSANNCFS